MLIKVLKLYEQTFDIQMFLKLGDFIGKLVTQIHTLTLLETPKCVL